MRPDAGASGSETYESSSAPGPAGAAAEPVSAAAAAGPARGSAGRSVAMLLGFLLLAWLQVGAVLLVVLLILRPLPGSLALGVGVPLVIAVAGLLWWATVRALRLRRSTPAGVPVLRRHAPALWTMLDEAAAAAGVQPPDGVTVVAGATVALFQPLRLGGLLGGRRELYLGVPLLQAWDGSRLRAAVAHELAHGSPALGGRFAPAARRGRVALGRIVPRIPRRSPAGPLLRAWARFYLRVDTPYSHAQELAADRVAAGFAGPRATAAVLRDRPALEAMQQLFHAEYLSPGWQTGLVPDDVFGGFLRVLAARGDDLAVLRAREPEAPGPWDPHPPLAERLAALAAITPEGPEPPAGPAGDLVPDLPGLGRALQAVAFPVGGRAVVGWDEFFGVARLAEMEREADASLRALSRAAGTPVTGASEVLDLAADGRLHKIAESVFGDLPPDEISGRVTNLIALLLALAALHSGVARWRHSWSGTAELVAIDGSYLELQAPAEMAGDPATVGQVREWLTTLGIDLTAAADTARHHSARVPVLGGVVGVQVDGARADLLVLETGLFLVPGLPRSRHHEAKRRLTRLAADGVLTDGTPAHPDAAGVGVGVGAASGGLSASNATAAARPPATADSRAADSRAADSRAADSRAADSRAADSRAADSRAADSRAADSRAAEPRAADSRAADSRAAGSAARVGAAESAAAGVGAAEFAGAGVGTVDGGAPGAGSAERGPLSAGAGVVGAASAATGSVGGSAAGADSGERGSAGAGLVETARAETAPTGPGMAAAGVEGGAAAPSIAQEGVAGATGSVGRGFVPEQARSADGLDPALARRPAAGGPATSVARHPDARTNDAAAGSRFVPFADVATASAGRNGRRSWEINLHDGGTITVRSTLDSEELPGGWAALDDAVAFLTRTR